MVESVIVAAILLGAAFYLYRSWRKTAKGKGCGGKSCGCKNKPR